MPTPLASPGAYRDAMDDVASLWSEINTNLSEYELRACFGDKYRTDEEQVIASNPPGTLVFETDEGLVASGSQAFFRVYVKVTTGNEKGSNTVKVVRP